MTPLTVQYAISLFVYTVQLLQSLLHYPSYSYYGSKLYIIVLSILSVDTLHVLTSLFIELARLQYSSKYARYVNCML
jgi:hypothetical protein